MQSNYGTLFIVPTPVGNLEDITLRAIKVLKDVDYILAEDTRHSLKLLNHFNITNSLISYYKDVEKKKLQNIINDLKNGKDIALISDAGTPGISDPGNILIKEAIKENIKVTTLPGATALIPAIVTSNFDTTHFIFYGFLNNNTTKRKKELENILSFNFPTIIYEAPHRILKTLKTISEIDEKTEICIAREISKIHEQYIYGTVTEVLEKLESLKGEIVLIIYNAKENNDILKNLTLEEHYSYYEHKGLSKKEIIKQIARDLNVNKDTIYKKFIND
ncbi:MAG: 16S rRNA (cytidine(1402)-2'-O)-methyltransferase [Clostridium sp.]